MGGRGRFDLRGGEGNVARATDRSDTLWKGHQPRNTGGVTGRWKRQGNSLSWSLQKEPAVPTFWYLTLWKWFQTSDLQNYRRISRVKSPGLCEFVIPATGNYYYSIVWLYLSSLVAQMVKNLPAMKETQVQSLGWEDLLAKGSVFLPGEFHGQRCLSQWIYRFTSWYILIWGSAESSCQAYS